MKLDGVLLKEKPDFVLVYGDTNSSLAVALCAAKLGFRIGHVEAGPRGYDRTIPEEINRVVVDHISEFLFAPTEVAVRNLKKEGLHGTLVGNIMIESMLLCLPKVSDAIMKKHGLEKGRYVLATVHRAVNTNVRERLEKIVNGFVESGVKIVLPLHPRTRKALQDYGLMQKLENAKNILLLPPVPFGTMLALERYCAKIATDSGGVEYEGYALNIPTLVLTDDSDWEMTLDGSARIADLDKLAKELRKDEKLERKTPREEDTKVSERIVKVLMKEMRK
jgi:UDP-N-acetylglucosamine 2-epimerase (non-hydrolysing)